MATVRKSQNGWPVHPTSAGCVPLSWITGRVDPRTHDLFDQFCKRFDAEVEPIVRAHSWGYANRAIRGSTQVSNHASGTAIDLNAPAHPLGKTGTFTTAQVRAIKAILRDFPQLRWGGSYSGRKDEMHFELNVKPEALNVTARMVSPAEGRFTSGYGKRKLSLAPFHAGVDIAPPVPGTIGEPVVAAFAGVVERAGWGIVKYRSGNGVLIRNPDDERQYYGHLNKIRVKVGQSVKAGDRIGDMGATGKVTGAHLHFETWRNSSQSSHYDPKLAFDKHGVTIGSKPNVSGGATPAPDPTPTKDWFDMATQKELESALWNVLNRDITVGGSTGKRYKGGTAPLYSLIRDGAYALDAAQDIPRQVMMYDISVGGSTKKAIGKDSTTAAALLRYAAAAVYDGRNQHAQSTARQDALQAAVAELARERGVDAKVITAAIDKAVAAAISELGATLDAEV